MTDLIERLRSPVIGIPVAVQNQLEAADEIERLRGIIVKWYEYWPEPWGEGRDGFEMQEFGEKHGILIGTEQTTPCSEQCNCAEYFGHGDTVTCYRLAPEYLEALAGGRDEG